MSRSSLDQIERHVNYDKVEVELQYVTPLLAESYLASNFANNRSIGEDHLKELMKEMRSGRFTISDSAICFDEKGELVNGQHRLTAIVRTKTTQPLIIVRNVPEETKLILDIGRSRRMDDRITISGTRISRTYCAAVRHAMLANLTSSSLGTTEFSKPRHDKEVARIYNNHSQFFDKLTDCKFGATRAFWVAAAFKIYVQMENGKHDGRRKEYEHNMEPLERAIHWLHITSTGCAGVINGVPQSITPEDRAAQLIQMKANRRLLEEKRNWGDAQAWAMTVRAAHHFMMGTPLSYIKAATFDPFLSIRKARSTNKIGFGS